MILIVAADEKWGIGIKGDLLTPLPEDMKFFREKTKGSVVVYGRKTLESFPNHKPLPNRINIVLTNNKDFQCEGTTVVHSIEEALKECEKYTDREVFLIGGGTLYRSMLKYCNKAYITKIEKTFDEADTFIYNLDEMSDWKQTEVSDQKEYKGTYFRFTTYERV